MTERQYVQYYTESTPQDLEDGISERLTWDLDQDNDGQEVNVELLRQTLEFVTEHPMLHRQRTWFTFREDHGPSTSDPEIVERVKARQAETGEKVVPALADTACGTAGCLFGWAAVIQGDLVKVVVTKGVSWMYPEREYAQIELDTPEHDWESAGRHVLGLSIHNAIALSHADNSIGDLWRMASIITSGAIVVPERFAAYDGVAEAERLAAVQEERAALDRETYGGG